MCASLDLRDPVGACLLLKDAANGNTKGLSSQAMLPLAVKAAVSQTKQGMLGCTMQHLSDAFTVQVSAHLCMR